MHRLNFDARRLGFLLGLGDLNACEVCHGFQNGCGCKECKERAEGKRKRPARQPWERAA